MSINTQPLTRGRTCIKKKKKEILRLFQTYRIRNYLQVIFIYTWEPLLYRKVPWNFMFCSSVEHYSNLYSLKRKKVIRIFIIVASSFCFWFQSQVCFLISVLSEYNIPIIHKFKRIFLKGQDSLDKIDSFNSL